MSGSPDTAAGAGTPLVVTVSAAYGAGGSVVAPRLADALGLAWLDRMVSTETAMNTAPGSCGEGLSEAEEAATPGRRLFVYLARAAGVGAVAPPDSFVDPDQQLRERAEADITRLCEEGGVILGRAAAVVLRDRPATFHVRLEGPKQRRLERAAAIDGVSAGDAERRMEETDRARVLYVRRLYHTDPTDPSLYHLVLDTTVMPLERAVDVLVAAVDAYGAALRGTAASISGSPFPHR